MALTCLAPIGCDSPGWQLGADQDQPAAPAATAGPRLSGLAPDDDEPDAEASPAERRPVVALQVTFDILRARVPRGFFSESGRIWNHLDEEAIPAAAAAMLQRNGFRVARGRDDSWPPIRALLEDEGQVETSQDQMAVLNGFPLTVELDEWPRDQTLFLVRADGVPAGASFPASMNLLRIEYELSLTDPSSLRLKVMPALRLCGQQPRLRLDRWGRLEGPRTPPSRVLRELAFTIEVGSDAFLVIGPSPAVQTSHVAGALLLCEEIDGSTFESMYFVTPRVFRMGQADVP